MRYIDDNLTDDINIQSVSDALNISRSQLSHLFKDYTGTSLWNYITMKRIRHAQMLLRQGVSITEACYDSGFNNYGRFIKVFSKITGMPPGKYVKIVKEET